MDPGSEKRAFLVSCTQATKATEKSQAAYNWSRSFENQSCNFIKSVHKSLAMLVNMIIFFLYLTSQAFTKTLYKVATLVFKGPASVLHLELEKQLFKIQPWRSKKVFFSSLIEILWQLVLDFEKPHWNKNSAFYRFFASLNSDITDQHLVTRIQLKWKTKGDQMQEKYPNDLMMDL